MHLVVVGTGYVGLTSAVAFAEVGHQVLCLDIDEERIALLKRAEMPFFEPGVGEVLQRNVANGLLAFTTDYREALQHGTLLLLALPTPTKADGQSDLSYFYQALEAIMAVMERDLICIVKSTVPPGTCHALAVFCRQRLEKLRIDFVSNPEFLKEGDALNDCMKPDRIVIGCDDNSLQPLFKELYAPFNRSCDRMLWMDVRSSELAKYACNAMLATRISFMNDLARLCEILQADIEQIRKVMGADHRIGYAFLYAGLGYGGSCFPKDLQALISLAREKESPLQLIEACEAVNQRQKRWFLEKITQVLGTVKGKRLAFWGLSFKPGTDDLRCAPALFLAEQLLEEGALLQLFDPVAMEKAKQQPLFQRFEQQVSFAGGAIACCHQVDALILCTEWKQFARVQLEELKSVMRQPILFDGRNQYNPEEMRKAGFTYLCVGRP